MNSAHLPTHEREYGVNLQSPLAGLLCLLGIGLHIVLSAPFLDAHGFNYSGDGGAFYEKLHPGTYVIYAGFACLLFQRGAPLKQWFILYRHCPLVSFVFALHILLLSYMWLRDGASGLSFFLDAHVTAIACVLILAFTPLHYAYTGLRLLIILAVLNSLIGVAEAWGKFRIFAYAPEWDVLTEKYFRASALRGHPLANAAFTALALFLALAMRYATYVKVLLAILFLTALLAYGGRTAYIVSVVGIMVYAAERVLHNIWHGNITLFQLFFGAAMAIALPVMLFAVFFLATQSGLGERITAYASLSDDSAASRQLAFSVFGYMRGDEMLLGVSNDRIEEIIGHMAQHLPLAHIENPWLLMFMHLGAVGFICWAVAILALVWQMVKKRLFALKLVALTYLIIASSFNSFASKDSTWIIFLSALACASRILPGRVTSPERYS